MSVTILFFAQCADWAQKKEITISVHDDPTILNLLQRIPEAQSIVERKDFLKVARNHEMVNFETLVSDGDEVAIMPPFSGG